LREIGGRNLRRPTIVNLMAGRREQETAPRRRICHNEPPYATHDMRQRKRGVPYSGPMRSQSPLSRGRMDAARRRKRRRAPPVSRLSQTVPVDPMGRMIPSAHLENRPAECGANYGTVAGTGMM
jgi:hypothetical protein